MTSNMYNEHTVSEIYYLNLLKHTTCWPFTIYGLPCPPPPRPSLNPLYPLFGIVNKYHPKIFGGLSRANAADWLNLKFVVV